MEAGAPQAGEVGMTDARPTFVYFVTPADRSMVKIGVSCNPEHRLSGLMTWSPVPLEILAFVPGTANDERALHRRYLRQHSHREWFRSTPEMLADIAAISRFGELPTAFRGGEKEGNALSQTGIRATPEWRAKVSATHKEAWAKRKANKKLEALVAGFCSRQKIGADEFNSLYGSEIAYQRQDGSYYIYESSDAHICAIENFIAAHAPVAGSA
jgi:hypothetical protein